ncbi:MAG: cytochrome P450 [Vicinamibacterales bacterium]
MKRVEAFPLGARVRLDDLDRDPYPTFHELRAHEPVSWVAETSMWFVTRRDDVLAVLRAPDVFGTDHPGSTIRDTFGPQMLSLDGELHHRYKKLCAPMFAAGAVQASMAAPLERFVRDRLARVREAHTAEMRSTLASPLALWTMARLLGLPLDRVDDLRTWYDDFAAALANFRGDPDVRQRAAASVASFRELVASLLPDLDVGGGLLASLRLEAAPPLELEAIVSNLLIVLFGGIETTESLILNLLWTVLERPALVRRVAADPSLRASVIEETLRWEPPVQSCTRHVRRATVLRGVALAEGDTVQCMIGAANRDPAHFADPDVFDHQRPNAGDHLSFGAGPHFCLGAALARLEASVALAVVCAELEGARLDRDRPSSPRGYEFRKPPALWIRWA